MNLKNSSDFCQNLGSTTNVGQICCLMVHRIGGGLLLELFHYFSNFRVIQEFQKLWIGHKAGYIFRQYPIHDFRILKYFFKLGVTLYGNEYGAYFIIILCLIAFICPLPDSVAGFGRMVRILNLSIRTVPRPIDLIV